MFCFCVYSIYCQRVMPRDIHLRLENPVKLVDKCLQVIAKNFENILSKCSSYLNLRCLQRKSQLLLKTFKKIQGKHVPLQRALFCLPHIKELDFEWFQKCDKLHIAHTLGTVESAITVLNASNVSLAVMRELLPLLPKSLKCLTLGHAYVTNKRMKIVAERCPDLEELELFGCDRLGDCGLKTLCYEDEQGHIYPNLVLQKLRLKLDCAVTSKGVAFILDNCPNLSEFEHDYVFKVIYKKYCRAISSGSLENELRYNLKSVIFLDEYSLHYNYLKSLSILCPLVRKLQVSIYSQKELDICAEFPSLIDVDFCTYDSFDLSFFLQSRGRTLKSLRIFNSSVINNSSVASVSSEMLVEFCPRLEHLLLYEPKFVSVKTVTNRSRQDTLFSLTQLEIINAHPDYLEESLIYLLSMSLRLERFVFGNKASHIFVSSSFESLCNSLSTLKEVRMVNVDGCFTKLLDTFQNFSRS